MGREAVGRGSGTVGTLLSRLLRLSIFIGRRDGLGGIRIRGWSRNRRRELTSSDILTETGASAPVLLAAALDEFLEPDDTKLRSGGHSPCRSKNSVPPGQPPICSDRSGMVRNFFAAFGRFD